MSHGPGHTVDTTSAAAVGDVASASLFEEILSRIEGKEDRVLLLANIGLEIPVRSLARTLQIDPEEVSRRIDSLLALLRADESLTAKLRDIRRAGRVGNYHALALNLGLQDYFCSSCAGFMTPSHAVAARKTCSGRCRTRLYRAGGASWKDAAHSGSSNARPRSDGTRLGWTPPTDKALERVLHSLNANGRYERRGGDTRIRDRAFVLLAFTCPVELTPLEMVGIDLNDIALRADDIEIRLRVNGLTRYATVPARKETVAICPLTALVEWRRRLHRSGAVSTPLFVRTDNMGKIVEPLSRLHPFAAAHIVTAAGRIGRRWDWSQATPSTTISSYLEQIR